jgi:RNA ligase
VEIQKYINIEILNEYEQNGLLTKNKHPKFDLFIWNYTPKTQYESLWDNVTLSCRGLVTDNDGNIIALSFTKFFNIEEGKFEPTEKFEVWEKMDGSLGIVFWYEGQWVVATRGSFTSDQSIKAKELLKKYNTDIMFRHLTFCFEVLYKNNQIVVDYGDYEGLVLLGTFDTAGKEYDIEMWGEYGFDVVKKYDGIKDYKELKEMVKNDQEGFVVKFSNGDRIKVKGIEYLRLHKIMTNVTTTGIWEYLKNGEDVLDLLKDVPDESYNKIKSYVKDLKYGFFQISEYCGKSHDGFRYGKFGDKELEPTKKEFAEFMVLNNIKPKLRSVMFAMWDKKPYDHIIWGLIKPEFRKL